MGTGSLADAVGSAAGALMPHAGDATHACAHCALPVPAALQDPDAPREFCCAGCATAWSLIHEHGLDRYYDFAERRAAPVTASGKDYAEFDHATFRELYVRPMADGLSRVELYLEGVHCASCVWLVERVPLLLPGVARAELDVRRALAVIVWDASATPLSSVARTLDALGYPPHPFRGVAREDMRRREDRAMLARIGIAGAIAANVMLLALALYSGWLGGMDAGYERLFRVLSLVLTAVAVVGPGKAFFTGAWASVRLRRLHMDLPIAIALGAGCARGAVNVWTGEGPIYFDGVATLIFLLLSGRYLQQRGQRAATDASEFLAALAPADAHVVGDDGTEREVPVEALLPGMRVAVRAGETLPADGVVSGGRSALDCALLTGESRPVPVTEGDPVFAGTVNLSGPLVVTVREAGERTRLGILLQRMEEGLRRRAPVVLLADRLAGWFVGIVLTLAAVTWWMWVDRDPRMAVDHAIALLIVTCPCALALATPLAMSVAAGRAARRGILVKGTDALESLTRPGTLFLDKTGTVTEGHARLVRWEGDPDVRALVLGLERESAHPLAAAFLRAWGDVVPATATQVEQVLGGGIRGVVAGREVAVGAPGWVSDLTAGVTPATWKDDAPPPAAGGGTDAASTGPTPPDALTPVWVAVDGTVVGRAWFGDPVRPEARAAVGELHRRGWRVRLLSGDDPAVVRSVAGALGIAADDAQGGVAPEGKLRAVHAAKARGTTVMVGDGVNDAAAIAAATVGIGVHGGAEASMAAADVYLARPGLAPLVELVRGADRTMRLLRLNILFSLFYNVIGASFAVVGWMDPLVAAILMPLASLSVVLTSWRGETFDRQPLSRGGTGARHGSAVIPAPAGRGA